MQRLKDAVKPLETIFMVLRTQTRAANTSGVQPLLTLSKKNAFISVYAIFKRFYLGNGDCRGPG